MKTRYLPFALFYLCLIWFAKDHAFFWDTVQLSSKQAHWFYDNNFQHFFLPERIDSGHPTFFPMALAGLWSVFGRSLWVGHFAMLPFLFGIVYLTARIGDYFVDKKAVVYILLLLAVDPFVLGQSVLVSPDIPVLFAWLLGLYAILYQRAWWKIMAALLLAMISMRGMMLVLVLFLFDLFRNWPAGDRKKLTSVFGIKWFFEKLGPYIPAGLCGIAYLGGHYMHTGWIGYHADSPWAPSFEKTNFVESLRNVGLLIWRLLDFGRVAICLLLAVGGGLLVLRKAKLESKAKELLGLLFFSFLVLCPSLILHKYLMAHRYIMPITTVMTFATVYVLMTIIKNKLWQKITFVLLFAALLTGNAWVYPKKIAQGWDSTLAHWPYYDLRKEMLTYLKQESIPLEAVGTAFPNNVDLRYTDLIEGQGNFPLFDLDQQQYIFYSNVYNDFSDEDIDALDKEWKVKKKFERLNICVVLYEKE